jgi:glycosyltransferase involved in cell wall biosynthesis
MSAVKVAYVLDEFPVTTQTFVAWEIEEVSRQLSVVILAMDRPGGEILHDVAGGLLSRAEYLKFPHSSRLWAATILLLRHPRRAVNAFRRAFRKPHYALASSLKDASVLARALRRHGATHAHCHFAGRAATMTMFASLLTGIPFSLTVHGYDVFFRPPPWYDLLGRLCSQLVTVSQFNRHYLVTHFGLDPARIVVIPCGVDTTVFSPPASGAPRHDPPVILSVARLDKVKGLDHLLQACSILAARGRTFQCVIAGEGPDRARLEGLIEQLGLASRVRLAGALRHEALPELYRAATIFVLPSLSEAMPVALMEAMATGLPVIGPQVNGVPELVLPDATGLLVAPGDEAGLAEHLDTLLGDADLRVRLGSGARRTIEQTFERKHQVMRLISSWQKAA